MSHIISRPWHSVLVLALLATSAVHGQPIRQEKGEATEIETRSPRLIPDTEKYVHEVFQGLGLADPSPSSRPTASVEAKQGQAENMKATPTTHITYESSISYTPTYGSNGAGFTHTVKHQASSDKPIANVQIGQGWDKNRKLTSEDLPILFDAVYRELKHRVGNAIDSSDEIGLDEFMNGL